MKRAHVFSLKSEAARRQHLQSPGDEGGQLDLFMGMSANLNNFLISELCYLTLLPHSVSET